MKDLRKKSDTDLLKHIADARESLRSLRFAAGGSGTRDAHAFRSTRKEIARALTEHNRRSNGDSQDNI
ncbi:50S ribosomal protein L29 [Candidatus Kaiserbacteria bacterium]|nr:50S ribosomal protein L29 [Candidatus Kaiserbacteria bacterium]